MAASLAMSSTARAVAFLHPRPLPAQLRCSRFLRSPNAVRLGFLRRRISSPVPLQSRVPLPCAPIAAASASAASFIPASAASLASLVASAAADLPRNISTLAALAASAVARLLADAGQSFAVAGIQTAAVTPMTSAVAAGVAKWVDLYREVLLVRCLLSWFPNLAWEWQPFSAIRDISDPYLNIFRSIVPPVLGGTLDVSSLVAFVVLGMLASLLNTRIAGSVGG